MSENYPQEIIVNGKRYVHGPAIPAAQCKTPEKCAHCAGSKPGMTCAAFGYECLCTAGVYWILRPKLDLPREKLADIPAVERATCPKCRKRYRGPTGVAVKMADGVSERWCPWCAVEHAVECQKCGAKSSEGYGRSVSGSHWCGDCIIAYTKACGCCGKRVDAATLKSVESASGTEHWCPECAAAKSKICAHCGERVKTSETRSVDGAAWCKRCVEDAAEQCGSCGNWSADLQTLEDGGDRLCPVCLERASRAQVYGYHGFPQRDRPKFWKAAGEETAGGPLLYLGFELEAGGATSAGSAGAANAIHRIDPTEVRFHMERDSSIPDYGFELISSPHTLAAHAAYRWNDVVKAMASRGMKSHDLNGECGLHVHVSRDFLTSADCTGVDLFVLKNRKFWERVSRRSQTDMAAYKDKARLSEFGRSGERHVAVNFTNVATVEFRMFRGTLKYETLMATLEIVDGLCRWVKTRTADELLANDGEVERFAAWLAGGGDRYARAVKYIEERKAVDDPNGSSPSAGD